VRLLPQDVLKAQAIAEALASWSGLGWLIALFIAPSRALVVLGLPLVLALIAGSVAIGLMAKCPSCGKALNVRIGSAHSKFDWKALQHQYLPLYIFRQEELACPHCGNTIRLKEIRNAP